MKPKAETVWVVVAGLTLVAFQVLPPPPPDGSDFLFQLGWRAGYFIGQFENLFR